MVRFGHCSNRARSDLTNGMVRKPSDMAHVINCVYFVVKYINIGKEVRNKIESLLIKRFIDKNNFEISKQKSTTTIIYGI